MNREYLDDELRDSLEFPVSIKGAIRKSCQDQKFKSLLLSQPTETLKAEGWDLPSGVEVEVLQDTDEVLHLVLPFNGISSETELSDAQLASVAGGARRTSGSRSMFS